MAVSFSDVLFKNLNLTIKQGEKLLIYGRSGIGKSVLFRLLLGFITPAEGRIFFNHNLVDGKTVWEVRKKIAYVSQDTDLGEGTVEDIIRGYYSYQANSHLELNPAELQSLFHKFHLTTGIMTKNINELSGGERQRIAIILAVLLKREVFLLDEITASLDGELKDTVTGFFMENPAWTVLIVSHDRNWLEKGNVRVFNMEEVI